jgi:hypothetical protein
MVKSAAYCVSLCEVNLILAMGEGQGVVGVPTTAVGESWKGASEDNRSGAVFSRYVNSNRYIMLRQQF